jgi:hypothetical protein
MLIPYLSYWSKGYRKTPSKYIIDLHKLSAFLCKKQYGEVHLITDSASISHFKEIGFDSITVPDGLDEIPDEYSLTWSLGKVYCFNFLAKNKIPFLHVDYDVFLWKQLPDFIHNSDVFVQHTETNVSEFYHINKMINQCGYKNFPVDQVVDFAYNMGIFGGNDCSFIEDYSSASIELVMHKENKNFWSCDDKDTQALFTGRAVLAEQWYLANFAKQKNKTVTCLFDGNMPSDTDAELCGYTHLWGAKGEEETIKKVYKCMEKYNLI